MISISFTAAIEETDCHVSLPFSNLAPRRAIEAKTLADCERAFKDACDFARTIPAADVLAHFGARAEKGGAPCVSVHLSWASRDRKPSGFLHRRWSAYVACVPQVVAAAE